MLNLAFSVFEGFKEKIIEFPLRDYLGRREVKWFISSLIFDDILICLKFGDAKGIIIII
jgi:hypothetical protein